MARSRSRSAPRPAPRAHSTSTQARRSPSPPPPMARPGAPPPAQQQGGGMMSGLGGMVMQGMALGTGSAMAHRAVDAVMGSRHPEPQEAQAAAQTIVQENLPCTEQAKAFSDCMSFANERGYDMGACQHYFESMQQCRLSLQQ